MKRGAQLAVVLLVIAGATLALVRRDGAVPPGFVSIKDAPAYQDAALLERAWALPVAKSFRIANFGEAPLMSQRNPSACGPTSVANVLRTIGRPSTSDDVAAHGKGCLAGFCFGGLTLDELADATRATASGWKVEVVRPATLDAFRDELRQANDLSRRLIINFHRRPLFGSGGGHHSPIGGYLEAEDLVFVLDVNERFGPWFVSSARLFEAMDTLDGTQKRGLLRLSK